MPWSAAAVAAISILSLESELREAAAPVAESRTVLGVGDDETAAAIDEMFRELERDIAGFERIIARSNRDTMHIVEADGFFDEATALGIRRIEALFREWAPLWATRRVPETHRITLAFPKFFRRYNDTVTRLVRTMLDCAGALNQRLLDDEQEELEAQAWADRHPGWTSDDDEADESVPIAEARAALFPGGASH